VPAAAPPPVPEPEREGPAPPGAVDAMGGALATRRAAVPVTVTRLPPGAPRTGGAAPSGRPPGG